VAEDLLVILVVEGRPSGPDYGRRESLADGGFEPAIAASGEEAVTLLKGGLTKYRALVTDINLPGRMDGWKSPSAPESSNPEFPVVYMTGASADDYGSQGGPTASF